MAYQIRRVVLCAEAGKRAMRAVKEAVKDGRLPSLKQKRVKCADCDKRATDYDHRRYSEPLNVQPVCRAHNMQRGFALDQTFKDAITGEPRTVEDYRTERCKKVPRVGVAGRVMSAITGAANYLQDAQAKREWKDARRRGRWAARIDEKRAYLNAEHAYKLRVGGVDTDERKTMTGHEALIANRAAEAAFIKAIQTDKRARMQRWSLVDYINTRPARHTKIGQWAAKCSHVRFGKA